MTAWTASAFTLAASVYTGFQWTIRVVVYPQFAAVPAPAFPEYERRHQHRVTLAVGPLFAALVVTTIGLVVLPSGSIPRWSTTAAAVCVAGILVVTWSLAVPLHRALSAEFDPMLHRRLLRVDTLRLGLSVAATALGCWSVVAA